MATSNTIPARPFPCGDQGQQACPPVPALTDAERAVLAHPLLQVSAARVQLAVERSGSVGAYIESLERALADYDPLSGF